MKNQDLSVIILSYNTRQLLKNCLAGLSRSTKGIDFEVIVVDNASRDGSPQMVKKEFPKVKLIINRQNLGFAGGNNQGIKKARGRYLLLLNSDTMIKENALAKMVGFMDKDEKLGIATCQLLNEDGSIQASGGFFPNLGRIFAWMFFLDDLPLVSKLIKAYHPHEPRFYTRDSFYQKEHSQDWVTGAFFMIRREVIDKIGLLDPQFFMYVEEVDYCYRAKKAGFVVAYTPEAQITHLGRRSLKKPGKAIVGEYQGLKIFYQKHYSFSQLPLLVLFLKLGAALRFLVFGVILASQEARVAYAEAIKAI
jgi:GT2 family glycosyltransferase